MFELWDSSHRDMHRHITNVYFRIVNTAILVYDVGDRGTFDGMKVYMQIIKEKAPEDFNVFIVGNKTDLAEFEVPLGEVEEYAQSVNVLFRLISVK